MSSELLNLVPLNLVCLPHAGGAAASFRRWQRGLGNGIAVHGFDYPGRASRIDEPRVIDSAAIVDDIAARVAQLGAGNCVLFGHSMGGWVAFEVARRLEQAGTGPAGLVVSAAPAPSVVRPRAEALTDQQLRAKVLKWGGTPVELLDDNDFRERLFGHVRADLATIASYVPQRAGAVSTPMIALAGRSDSTAPSREVAEWAQRAHDWRGIRIVPGGHFFTTTAEDLVLRIIAQYCRTVQLERPRVATAASGY